VDKETKYIVVILIIAGLGLVTASSLDSLDMRTIVSGYGGVTAEIIDASARPADGIDGSAKVNVDLNGTIASVDPAGTWVGVAYVNPTIVECEIQGKLNIINEEPDDPQNQTIDNGDGTYTHKLWEVRDVFFDMGITVRTKAGNGLLPTYDSVFTIKVEENQFSVFDDPDEVICYIMEVYTLDTIATDDVGKTEGSPTSSGYYFALDTLGTNPVPQWLIDGGYQEDVLGQFQAVSFDVKASYMEPSVGIGTRYEHALSWKVGVTARVFGYWEHTGTNKNFTPGPGETPWWENLFAGLGFGLGKLVQTITTAIIVVVVVYVIVKIYRARGD
jgi:hypothetical protein